MQNSIKQVRVKNYRSLVDVEVSLSPLTVLVGQNGSGKSNFIDALHFVSDAVRFSFDAAVERRNGIGRLRHTPEETVIDLRLLIDDVECWYTFTSNADLGATPVIVSHELFASNGQIIFERDAARWKTLPDGVRLPEKQPGLVLPVLAGLPSIAGAFEYLKDMIFYEIAPSVVRESLIKGERPTKSGAETRLDQNGGNFLAVLLDLWTSESRKIDFVNSLEAALPHTAQLKVEANLRLSSQTFVVSELPGQYFLPLREESDGTLRFAAMLLALSQEPAPSLIALEEPELFIHPGAMAVLCDLLKEAALTSQIIISTHSPDIIDRFDVDHLRVVERTSEGTKIGFVDEVQRSVVQDKLFSAGELLNIEGLQRDRSESYK